MNEQLTTNTCPGCLWLGAPTGEGNLMRCTTFHCRVDVYFTISPGVLVA